MGRRHTGSGSHCRGCAPHSTACSPGCPEPCWLAAAACTVIITVSVWQAVSHHHSECLASRHSHHHSECLAGRHSYHQCLAGRHSHHQCLAGRVIISVWQADTVIITVSVWQADSHHRGECLAGRHSHHHSECLAGRQSSSVSGRQT